MQQREDSLKHIEKNLHKELDESAIHGFQVSLLPSP